MLASFQYRWGLSWGALLPPPAMEEGQPSWLPFLWAWHLLSAELRRPTVCPQQLPPCGTPSLVSPARVLSGAFPNGDGCPLQQPCFPVTPPDTALTEKQHNRSPGPRHIDFLFGPLSCVATRDVAGLIRFSHEGVQAREGSVPRLEGIGGNGEERGYILKPYI